MRTLVLRTPHSLPWLLAAVLAAAAARAQEAVPRVDVHGFGSWAYGRTDENVYLAGLPAGTYEETSFTLAVASQPSDRLRVTGQFELHQDVETKVELDYVFAEWRFSDALRLRAGKVKAPFGISAEVVRVGTLRPFLDLPQAVYGHVGITGEHYDGVGITGLLPRGRWTVSYDVYGGGLHVEESMGPEDLARGEPLGSDTMEVAKNVLGGRLVVQTPIDGLSFGVSANRGDAVDSKVRWVVGGHAEYLSGQWSIRSEYAHKEVRDDHIGDAFYVDAARRFGSHWQAAAQYGRFAAELPGVEAPVAPSLLEHEEVALGLNYWFNPAFVLKLSCHRVDGNRLAAPEADELAAVVASGRLQKRTNLLQFGAQFSF
mgnify:CR=1 FL=1